MNYRIYATVASILVVAGSLVYAAPRSARVRKEAPNNVAPQEDIDAILDTLSRVVTEDVTEDGVLLLAGVIGLEMASDGSMHVDVAYGGDFDRDMVLTIPRPATFDESGRLIAVRWADRIRPLEDHVVYIFDSVTDSGKLVSTARKLAVVSPGVADGCEAAFDVVTGKKKCKGECVFDSDECGWIVDADEDLICDCKKVVPAP